MEQSSETDASSHDSVRLSVARRLIQTPISSSSLRRRRADGEHLIWVPPHESNRWTQNRHESAQSHKNRSAAVLNLINHISLPTKTSVIKDDDVDTCESAREAAKTPFTGRDHESLMLQAHWIVSLCTYLCP